MLIKDTKVYAVLSKFDKYEQNRCRKYIQSPYFNANGRLVSLFELIVNHINRPSKKELTKNVIWEHLHKNKKYSDPRLRKYISDLLKLIEGYLSQQFYESNPLTAAMNLIKAVETKKIDDLNNVAIRNAKHCSDKLKSLTASFFFHQYKIEDYIFEISEYDIETNKKTNYEKIMDNLDQFFLIEKLKIYCGILSKESTSSFKYKVSLIEEILNYVEKNLEKVVPSVEIYYRVYLTYVKDQDVNNYQLLKEKLGKYSSKFSHQEVHELYLLLVNYCIKKIRSGRNDFYTEMFDLYKVMIANKIVYENGMLDPLLFKNIISVSTRLKEFKWAEDFIISNKGKLPDTQRENMVTYNLAMLSFMQKKHDTVITLLRDVEYSDTSISLQAKTMLLMTYYDTDEFEPLDFLLESFRVYINRHKEIPQKRSKYFKNLIKFTKKLTKVIPGDKTAVAKIKQEIEETEGFRVKWLEEKIAELES